MAYGITIRDGALVVDKPHTRIDSCTVINSQVAMRVPSWGMEA